MKKSSYIVLISLISISIIFLFGCSKEVKDNKDLELNKSNSRSFYMGMTPFPYDLTSEAVKKVYDITDESCDLIAHHFDNGVPWIEALHGNDYHQNVMGDIKFRVKNINKKQKVYLALTPISTLRDGLAGYRAEEGNLALPDNWKNKDFDDREVIEAYLNYCRYMINKFKPDYMCYGIEANILAEKNYEAYEKYLILSEKVYNTLKDEYPNIPIFQSIQLEEFIKNEEKQMKIVKELLFYSDYIAISSYPFTYKSNPKDLPEEWMTQISEAYPDKPIAIAETGFIADKLVLENLGIEIEGNEIWQSDYVKYLLEQSNDNDFEFIIWFVPKDYDKLWIKFAEKGVNEIFKIWRDSGLIDENDREREAKGLWDEWLKLPKRSYIDKQ